MSTAAPIKRYRFFVYGNDPSTFVDDDGRYVEYEAHQLVVARHQQEAEAFSAVVRELSLQLDGREAKIKALEGIIAHRDREIAHRDREIAHLEYFIRSIATTITRGPGALPCL
jgi:uncharacterized protein (DUF3084 family)